MSTLASVHGYDLAANLPAASIPGRLFNASDTGQRFRDNGTSWNSLDVARGVSIKTASYTVLASDNGTLIVMNSSSAATLTLPATSPGSWWSVAIQNIGTGTVTLSPGSLLLDGVTSGLALASGQGCDIYSDATNYFTMRGLSSSGGGGAGSGALTQISQQVLSAAVASVTFGSIPAIYTSLMLVVTASSATAANTDDVWLQFNGDTSTNYGNADQYNASSGSVSPYGASNTATPDVATISAATALVKGGSFTINIPGYAGAVFAKSAYSSGATNFSATTRDVQLHSGGVSWNSTSAINAIKLALFSGANFVVGSTFTLYGIGPSTAGASSLIAAPPYLTDGNGNFFVAQTGYKATLPAASPSFLSSSTFVPVVGTNGSLVATTSGAVWVKISCSSVIELVHQCILYGNWASVWAYDGTNIYAFYSGPNSSGWNFQKWTYGTTPAYSSNISLATSPGIIAGFVHSRLAYSGGTLSAQVSLDGSTWVTCGTVSSGALTQGGYVINSATAFIVSLKGA